MMTQSSTAKKPSNNDDGWTTITPGYKRRGKRDIIRITLNPVMTPVAATQVEENPVVATQAATSSSPASSSSYYAAATLQQKKQPVPERVQRAPLHEAELAKSGGMVSKAVQPKGDIIAHVVVLFDLFFNTPVDKIVASYQIDGRRVNLYGLRESSDEEDGVEVIYYFTGNHEYCIKFEAKREEKDGYSGRMIRRSLQIRFQNYDQRSGKITFYEEEGMGYPQVLFNSNLRHWLETYETILHNAQYVYMELVGGNLRRRPNFNTESITAGGNKGTSASATIPTALPPQQRKQKLDAESPIWPLATPEDLLGRLQWYMDRFAAPGNHQVLVRAIEGRLDFWSSDDVGIHGSKLLPTHLIKRADGVYIIVQRHSAPISTYHYKSGTMLQSAMVETRHHFKDISPDGSYKYWYNRIINGATNARHEDVDVDAVPSYTWNGNLYHLLNSPLAMMKMVDEIRFS
jgi:hypothetical protein